MKVDQNAYRQATVFLNTENCLIFASAEGKREKGIVRSLELGVKCEICAILVSFIDGFCGALSILDQE